MDSFIEIQQYSLLFNSIEGGIFIAVVLLVWRYLEKKIYILVLLPFAALILYFMAQRLETRIDDIGIHYHLFPSETKDKTIPWDHINYVCIRGNIPYKGRGSAYSGRGVASEVYTISNDVAMFIFLTDGSIVVIGTKRQEDIENYLRMLENKRILNFSI